MNTYLVLAHKLAGLIAAIAALATRAARLGQPGPGIEIGEHVDQVAEDGCVIRRVHVTISGEAPRIDGWRFVAALDHVGRAVVIRSIGGEVPERFRTARPVCEHCKLRRDRARTFVLQHEDGRVFQVGRSCLKDFLGHTSPDDLASVAELFTEVVDAAEDAEREEGGVGGGHGLKTTAVYLAYVAAVMRVHGWLSGKAAEETFPPRPSTAETASRWYVDGARLQPIDYARADAALGWAGAMSPRNDFEHNLRTLSRIAAIELKHLPIAAAILPAYDRHLEQLAAAAVSQHVGEVGKAIEIEVTVHVATLQLGPYGSPVFYAMRDTAGNAVVWKAARRGVLQVGGRYRLRAKVKEHGEYLGALQTKLSHAKVLETLHDPAAIAKAAEEQRRAEEMAEIERVNAAIEDAKAKAAAVHPRSFVSASVQVTRWEMRVRDGRLPTEVFETLCLRVAEQQVALDAMLESEKSEDENVVAAGRAALVAAAEALAAAQATHEEAR